MSGIPKLLRAMALLSTGCEAGEGRAAMRATRGERTARSLEALALTVLITWAVATRWWVVLAGLRDQLPRLALGYVLAFAAACSAVGNFGILARQRSLMFPFLFVFLAVALADEAGARGAPAGYSSSTPGRAGTQRRVSST